MCDRILPDMHRSHGVYKIAELFYIIWNTAAKSTAARTARQPEEKNDKHRATRKRIPSRNCGSAEGPENLTL